MSGTEYDILITFISGVVALEILCYVYVSMVQLFTFLCITTKEIFLIINLFVLLFVKIMPCTILWAIALHIFVISISIYIKKPSSIGFLVHVLYQRLSSIPFGNCIAILKALTSLQSKYITISKVRTHLLRGVSGSDTSFVICLSQIQRVSLVICGTCTTGKEIKVLLKIAIKEGKFSNFNKKTVFF